MGTTAKSRDLELVVAGQTIPFRYFTSKQGNNDCWGVLTPTATGPKFTGFGVGIPALADALPSEVEVKDPTSGKTITLGLATGQTQKLAPKVSGSKKVQLPNGEERMLSVSISQQKDGWNLKAIANSSGNGGGRRSFDLSAL